MNRSALLSALLVGLLVVQGSAYAVVGNPDGTGTAEHLDGDSSNVQSAFPDSVFADSHNSSGDGESDDATATTATTENSNGGSGDSESGTTNESGASGSSANEDSSDIITATDTEEEEGDATTTATSTASAGANEEDTTTGTDNEESEDSSNTTTASAVDEVKDEDASDMTTAVDTEEEKEDTSTTTVEDTSTTTVADADEDGADATTTATATADADGDDGDEDETTTTSSTASDGSGSGSDEETTAEAGSDEAASDGGSEDTPGGADASGNSGTDGKNGSEDGDTNEDDTSPETTTLPETADVDIEASGAGSTAGNGTASDEGTPSGGTPGQAPSGGAADAEGTSDEQAAAPASGGAGSSGASGAQPGGAGAGAADGRPPGSQATSGQTAGGQAPSSQASSGQAPSGAQAPSGGQAPAGQAPGSAQGGQAPGGAAAGGSAAPGGGAAPGGQGAGASSAQQGQQGATAGSSDADFGVVDSSLDAPIGTSGTLTVELENDGEDAENAVVDLQSQDGALTFGGSASASQFVGDWEEGETRTIEVDASVAPGADQRSYPVQASIAYENDDGNQVQSSPVSFGVTPDDEQDFTLDSVDSSLSAGDRGTISGTITNEGPADAESAVLVFAGNGSDVMPRQSEVVLGDLEDDESTDFAYPVAVREGAPPGERQVPFVVQYQNEAGNTVGSEQLNAQVEIDEADADFTVTDVDSELEPGETGIVEVTLENQGESVTDATVSLQSISPNIVFGQAANTSVFVGDWDDGETKTVEVRATATGTATEGEYPVQVSIAYTEEDNDQPPRAGPITFGVEVGDSDDDFAVTDVDSDLEPGESGTVEVTLENEDEDLTDATIDLQTLSPAITFGRTANASVFVGDWEEGETRTIEVRASVARDATEGEYPVQASVSYTEADDNRRGRAGPFAFGATVGQSADDFAVTDVNSTVPIGDQGTVRVTLRNDEENATESTVSLQSLSADLSLGPAANATQFVGDWEEGERRTVAFEVTASNRTERRSYPFQTSVSYTDTSNQRTQDGPYTIGVQPLREQAFTLGNATSNLSVGEEGRVSVTVTNEGPQAARNAVVQLSGGSQNINLLQEEVAIGTLAAGETATVSFPVEVSESAEAGQQQFSFEVEYNNQEGEPRTSESLNAQVEIEPQQDALTVGSGAGGGAGANASNASAGQDSAESGEPLQPGGSKVVTVPVTNNRDVPIRNIEAQAFTNDPLSLADDRSFVSELEPGETANLTFEVSASGDARPGSYPLSMDFQYETPDGDTKLSDTYEVPVEVEEPSGGLLSSITGGGGFPWLLIVFVLVIAGGAGYVLYRRQN